MYRNLLLILLVAAIAVACGNQNNTNQEQTTQEEEIVVEQPTVLALAEFKDKAESLLGKEVVLEGSVIHVCKHGGKKMFISADDPDVRIKITTGDETAAFGPELEGSYVKVLGIIEAIEAEAVGEGKLAGDGMLAEKGEHDEGEHGEGEHEEGEHEEDADHKNFYHKPQYSVAMIEYEVLETDPEGE